MRVGSGQWTVDGVIQTISRFKAQKITPLSFFYEFGFTPLCVHVCACMRVRVCVCYVQTWRLCN